MQNSLFFSALEIKYSGNSSTLIQRLLEKLYSLTIDEDSSMVVHVSHMPFVAKELSGAENFIHEKMRASTVLNSLPSSRDLVYFVKLFKSRFKYGISYSGA